MQSGRIVASTSVSILSSFPSSRSFQFLKYAHIYCLAFYPFCCSQYVPWWHALSHRRPEVLFPLFPPQGNLTVKMIGATQQYSISSPASSVTCWCSVNKYSHFLSNWLQWSCLLFLKIKKVSYQRLQRQFFLKKSKFNLLSIQCVALQSQIFTKKSTLPK